MFVKWKEGMWCRATLTELFQRGHLDPVRSCPVPELHRVRVYFQDYGFCKGIALQRYRRTRTHVKNLVGIKRDRTLICFFQSPRSVFLLHLYFPIPSEEAGPDLFIRDMNERLRRVDVAGQSEMSRWLPQAIKCSLKDIVPADLVSR